METIAVLGAGNMGTALAQVIAANGHRVRLWSIETDVLEEIQQRRTNSKYLAGVSLHEGVQACWVLGQALQGARLAIVSVPSRVVRSLAREMAPHLQPGQMVLNVAKGLEEKAHLRMSEVLAQELASPAQPGIASMGGPAIAAEMARGLPTSVIVGAADGDVAAYVQRTLQNEHLKVETTGDIVGLELGATLKNAYAIALGMCDGLGYGMNTKAFVASQALAELAALSTALGGDANTAYGLAGLGDLLTTGYSPHSRNRTLGERLCTDPHWQEFLRSHTVEGVAACRVARELARREGLILPLLEVIHDALFGGRPAAEGMQQFLREFRFGPDQPGQ